jgi:hypothetical protein
MASLEDRVSKLRDTLCDWEERRRHGEDFSRHQLLILGGKVREAEELQRKLAVLLDTTDLFIQKVLTIT